jgi:hypothetical protein
MISRGLIAARYGTSYWENSTYSWHTPSILQYMFCIISTVPLLYLREGHCHRNFSQDNSLAEDIQFLLSGIGVLETEIRTSEI